MNLETAAGVRPLGLKSGGYFSTPKSHLYCSLHSLHSVVHVFWQDTLPCRCTGASNSPLANQVTSLMTRRPGKVATPKDRRPLQTKTRTRHNLPNQLLGKDQPRSSLLLEYVNPSLLKLYVQELRPHILPSLYSSIPSIQPLGHHHRQPLPLLRKRRRARK